MIVSELGDVLLTMETERQLWVSSMLARGYPSEVNPSVDSLLLVGELASFCDRVRNSSSAYGKGFLARHEGGELAS